MTHDEIIREIVELEAFKANMEDDRYGPVEIFPTAFQQYMDQAIRAALADPRLVP